MGPHLAMQFHIEITPQKIETWLGDPGTVYPAAVRDGVVTVESPDAMRATRVASGWKMAPPVPTSLAPLSRMV